MSIVRLSAKLDRTDSNTSWGFRLAGGKDFGAPLVLQRVIPGSLAAKCGLQEGDTLTKIGGLSVEHLRHKEAQQKIIDSGNSLELTLQRSGSSMGGNGVDSSAYRPVAYQQPAFNAGSRPFANNSISSLSSQTGALNIGSSYDSAPASDTPVDNSNTQPVVRSEKPKILAPKPKLTPDVANSLSSGKTKDDTVDGGGHSKIVDTDAKSVPDVIPDSDVSRACGKPGATVCDINTASDTPCSSASVNSSSTLCDVDTPSIKERQGADVVSNTSDYTSSADAATSANAITSAITNTALKTSTTNIVLSTDTNAAVTADATTASAVTSTSRSTAAHTVSSTVAMTAGSTCDTASAGDVLKEAEQDVPPSSNQRNLKDGESIDTYQRAEVLADSKPSTTTESSTVVPSGKKTIDLPVIVSSKATDKTSDAKTNPSSTPAASKPTIPARPNRDKKIAQAQAADKVNTTVANATSAPVISTKNKNVDISKTSSESSDTIVKQDNGDKIARKDSGDMILKQDSEQKIVKEDIKDTVIIEQKIVKADSGNKVVRRQSETTKAQEIVIVTEAPKQVVITSKQSNIVTSTANVASTGQLTTDPCAVSESQQQQDVSETRSVEDVLKVEPERKKIIVKSKQTESITSTNNSTSSITNISSTINSATCGSEEVIQSSERKTITVSSKLNRSSDSLSTNTDTTSINTSEATDTANTDPSITSNSTFNVTVSNNIFTTASTDIAGKDTSGKDTTTTIPTAAASVAGDFPNIANEDSSSSFKAVAVPSEDVISVERKKIIVKQRVMDTEKSTGTPSDTSNEADNNNQVLINSNTGGGAGGSSSTAGPGGVGGSAPWRPRVPQGERHMKVGRAGEARSLPAAGVGSARIPMCSACSTYIRGPFISALDKTWCPDHFICANPTCRAPLLNIGFVEEEGQLYCERDYEQFLAPKCGKCGRSIVGEVVNAMRNTYHMGCFVCVQCHQPIGTGSFHNEDGKIYCQKDWAQNFQTKCYGCQFPIEPGDRWVEALSNNWHSECFNCSTCQVNLEGQGFVAKQGKPYCKKHGAGGRF